MFRRPCHVLAAVFAVLSPALAQAALLPAHTADAVVTPTGTVVDATATSTTASWQASGNQFHQYVIPFRLPNFGTVANPFTSATLTAQVTAVGHSQNWKWGTFFTLGTTAASPTVLASYVSSSPDFLQRISDGGGDFSSDVVRPGNYVGVNNNGVHTYARDNKIRNFLNARYAGGDGANQYVFLKFLATNDNGESFSSYTLTTADSTTGYTPRITYDSPHPIIPEPASLALAALGGLLLLPRRRRA